jgi:hypothetical protein
MGLRHVLRAHRPWSCPAVHRARALLLPRGMRRKPVMQGSTRVVRNPHPSPLRAAGAATRVKRARAELAISSRPISSSTPTHPLAPGPSRSEHSPFRQIHSPPHATSPPGVGWHSASTRWGMPGQLLPPESCGPCAIAGERLTAASDVSATYSVMLSVEFEPADPAAMIQRNTSFAAGCWSAD